MEVLPEISFHVCVIKRRVAKQYAILQNSQKNNFLKFWRLNVSICPQFLQILDLIDASVSKLSLAYFALEKKSYTVLPEVSFLHVCGYS